MPPPLRSLVRTTRGVLGKSLLARLVSSFLLLALGTVVLVAAAAFLRARATLRASILDRLATVAVVKESQLNLWVDEQRHDLVFLAGLPELRAETGAERVQALLDSARRVALDMDEVFLLSAVGGRVVASTDRRRVGEYRLDDPFFVHGRREPYIANVYPSPLTGRPTMTIATPVRGPDGTVRAVLAGHLNLSRIDEILAERTGLGATGEAYLVTQFNDFVSATRFGRTSARRGVHTAGVSAALAGRSGAGIYANYAGVRVLGAYRWIAPRELALLVEMNAAEAFAPAGVLVWTILVIGLGSALLLVGGVYLVARRIAGPILAVAGAASRVAEGDFDARAPVITGDEVGALARSFNAMADRLRALYGDLSRQVSETARANRALQESQELLQAIVDNSANVILALDPAGRVLLANRHCETLFGPDAAALPGRTPDAILPRPAAEAVQHAARAALEGRRVVEGDVDLVLHGGTYHYHLVAFPLVEAGRAPFGVGVVGVDLSERVRAEDERRRLEAGVQQAQKLESLGLLAGGIAHDFNNILTAIVGSTSLALRRLGPAAPGRADLAQVIPAAQRAARLTQQMLAYAGRASFVVEEFDVNVVIDEMAELIAVSVPKEVRLERALATEPPAIRGDRTQMSQVVLNLITNAAEAMRERGGVLRIRTAVRRREELDPRDYQFPLADAAEFVELTVEDQGYGMSPEILERVFDPFFSTKGYGRGLGLAAVLGIVKQFGGTLRVTSAVGVGTTFTVLFPSTGVTAPAAVPAPAAAAATPGIAGGAGTVLFAEDEETVRLAMTRVLESAGYTVLEARNGEDAVERFRTAGARLAAVILDVTMPVMGGADAFRAIRGGAAGPPVPVLFTSGYDQQEVVAQFAGEGVDFLQKPYLPEQLVARLERVIARRSQGSLAER